MNLSKMISCNFPQLKSSLMLLFNLTIFNIILQIGLDIIFIKLFWHFDHFLFWLFSISMLIIKDKSNLVKHSFLNVFFLLKDYCFYFFIFFFLVQNFFIYFVFLFYLFFMRFYFSFLANLLFYKSLIHYILTLNNTQVTYSKLTNKILSWIYLVI